MKLYGYQNPGMNASPYPDCAIVSCQMDADIGKYQALG
jgi:hypothetical protein